MSVQNPIGGLDAVLFDKDGTLIDYDRTWAPVNLRAVRMAAADDAALAARICAGGGIDPETGRPEPDSLFASGNTIELAGYLVAEGSRFGERELAVRLDSLFQSAARSSVPVTDLKMLFGTLKGAGIIIGIASNDSEIGVVETAKSLQIEGHLDFVCGYDSGHGVKPGPGMVHAFCAATEVNVSRTAVIGDSRHDMVMARTAGAMAIGVLSGTGTRRSLAGYCDTMLDSVADLPAVIGVSP